MIPLMTLTERVYVAHVQLLGEDPHAGVRVLNMSNKEFCLPGEVEM